MKYLKRLGYVLLFLYLAAAAGLYFGQEALIFHPHPVAAEYSYGNYEEEWFMLEDGQRLNALRLRSAPSRGVVLYLHGNVGSNGRSVYQTRKLQGLGYDLCLVDYRGFGKSEGNLAREADLTEDLQVVYRQLTEEYGEKNVVILGYSLGSGPACYLAANNQPQGVILVAPYRSLTAMKDRWFWMFPDFLLKYELNNAENLRQSTAPVVIYHGTADELIPVEMGRELAALDPQRIELREMVGVGHRGVILRAGLDKALGDFAKR